MPFHGCSGRNSSIPLESQSLVIRGEVTELAKALDQLLGSKQLRARLGQKARQMANERFSLKATGMALKELYEEIVSSPKTTPTPIPRS